jgi:uncharacterized protein YdgA (DUF945 family)
MKKILGAIGGLATVGVLSYPGFGFLVEKGLRHQLDATPKQYGLSIELTDFQRHWFTSDAKLLWKWQIPAHLTQNAQGQTITVSPQDFQKEFNIKIYHGPLVLVGHKPFLGIGFANTTLDWPLSSNLPTKSEFTPDSVFPQINLKMALNFLFQTSWNTEIPAFNLISKDNKRQLQWQGLSIDSKVGDNAKYSDGGIDFVGLHFKSEQTDIAFADFQLNYDFTLDKSGLYIGDAKVNLASIDMVDPEKNHINLADFNLKTDAEITQDNIFSVNYAMSLKKLDMNQTKMGPFELQFNFSDLNVDSMKRLTQSLRQEQNASPSFRQKNVWTLMAGLPDLLKYGMSFNLKKLHVVLDNGTIDSSAKIEVPKNASPYSDGFQALQNLNVDWNIQVTQDLLVTWGSKLLQSEMIAHADSSMQMPSEQEINALAVEKIKSKLASLEQAGVIQAKSSNYTVKILYKNGQFTVNDKPFDPSWLVI